MVIMVNIHLHAGMSVAGTNIHLLQTCSDTKKKAYFQQNIELLTWKCDFKNLFQENKRSFGPRSHSGRKAFHRI